VARASSASRVCDYQRKEKKAGRNGKRETTTSGHVCLIPQIISREQRVREERAIYSAHDRRDRTEQWSNILQATCRRAETCFSCTILIRGCPKPADGRIAQSLARGAAEQSSIVRGRPRIRKNSALLARIFGKRAMYSRQLPYPEPCITV
jgi:hypothetical protein